MKKLIFASLALALFLGTQTLHSMNNLNGVPPAIGAQGGTVNGGSTIQLGLNAGAQAPISIPMKALVNITQYDALVLVAGRGVSKTTTVGDINFIGFATETYAFGITNVQVARFGVIRARVGASAVAGDRLVTSASAGFLTPSTAVTAANYTAVSGTPIAARALETYTYSASQPSMLVIIGNQ